jgi:nucleoid DNA-binding protein
MRKIVKALQDTGRIDIPNFGTFELLPRRKGVTFCGFRNKEGVARYSKRVRFTISKELRDKLCK